MDLTGKNVVYVGGFGGIGFECCKELVTKNVNAVILLDYMENPKKLQELEKINPNVKVVFFQMDLTRGQKAIEAVLQKVIDYAGRIDILVNGSGVIADRDPKLTLDVNLLGLIETTLAAVPLMSKSNGGHGGQILHIASVLGLEPASFIAVYTASKHGVIGFAKSMSDPLYFEKTGITHTTVCPGFTDTPMISKFEDTFDYSKPLSDKVLNFVKTQPASACGRNMVKVMEKNENGSFWICDLGTVKQVKIPQLWQYQFK